MKAKTFGSTLRWSVMIVACCCAECGSGMITATDGTNFTPFTSQTQNVRTDREWRS
jgi:hypothetical protein